MIRPPIGVFLRELRRMRDEQTSVEMAAKLGVTSRYISCIERGSQLPSDDFEKKLCDAYSLNILALRKWLSDYGKSGSDDESLMDISSVFSDRDRGKTIGYYYFKERCVAHNISASEVCDALHIETSFLRFILRGQVRWKTTQKWVQEISRVAGFSMEETNEFECRMRHSVTHKEVDLSGLDGNERANASMIIDAVCNLSPSSLEKTVSYVTALAEKN